MKGKWAITTYNIENAPKFDTGNSGLPTLYSVLNSEDKKGIDKLTDKLKYMFFNGEVTKDFKKIVARIDSIYKFMKEKFYDDERDDGTRYFEHLREVANIVLTLPNPSIRKVEIALWHDGMEDKNISFDTIKDHSGIEVAIAVEALSKKPWQDYADNKEEGKKLRNEEYFGHLKSFESMKDYVQEICKKRNVELSEEEIDKLVQDIFDVKFADRIHNLSTQWDPNNIEKVERKVKETEEYFLEIAKQLNPEAYKRLIEYIKNLKKKIKINCK